MSHEDYIIGRELSLTPFYALIQAAMRKADTDNQRKLKECWPNVWAELQARYNAPEGLLDDEQAAIQGSLE